MAHTRTICYFALMILGWSLCDSPLSWNPQSWNGSSLGTASFGTANSLWAQSPVSDPAKDPAKDPAQVNAKQDARDDAAELLADEQAAFTAAASAAAPWVVQIETFAGLERVGKELVSDGPTTGTIIGKEGWILSSLYSFRQQPASILVSLPDGTRSAARIVARDHSRELVLLKIEPKSPLPEPIACPVSEVSVGQWVIGLGKTFERDSVSQSVGIISALDRAYGKAVQTDAKVSPVNYGGPLIDLQGRVIGILAPISPGAILEGDSAQLYDSGIGFAVPLADIRARLEKMQAGKDIHSGKLGIVVADQNELAGPVKVAGASPGSPAAKAGLKPGDTIVEAEGRKVELLAHLRHALGVTDAGSEFHFVVSRKGERVDMHCTLVEQVPTYRLRYLGIMAENLVAGGVRVTHVVPKSPAETAGLAVGSRIVRCNDIEIKTTTDLRQQLSVAELDQPFVLSVIAADATEAKPVSVKVVVRSNNIDSSENPTANKKANAERKIEEIELALGDFPNKAVAWCPEITQSNSDPKSEKKDADKADGADQPKADQPAASDDKSMQAREEFGLVILLPEPGEVDRNKLRELWSPIVREGFCVAIIESANKSRWTSEEIELVERVRAQIGQKRELDPARTIAAGQGVGGRLALVAARASKGKMSGVLTLGTPLENARLQRENSPGESLYFLLVGQRDSYAELLEQLQRFGFSASDISVPDMGPGKWDLMPVERITQWLVGLGRI